MRRSIGQPALAYCATALLAPSATAQTVRLPIPEGVWVKTDTKCGAATNVFVYGGNRFGSLYFYGPNQSMGPANETEPLSHVGVGKNGFSVVNDGPIEVAPRPSGQAAVRAYSPTQGVTWIETVRLCPTATLSAKLRAALAPFRLDGGGARK